MGIKRTAVSQTARNFRELLVWQKAHALAVATYRATASFPAQELYGLTSQIRRSSASIPSNIAEGCGRGSSVELARYFQIARGSASELEYQILLAHDLQFLSPIDFQVISSEVVDIQKMLTSYRQKLLNGKS